MPIQNIIASQLLSGAITAAAKASLMLPEECSPAIRESAQIYAAVAHVASELHDVPEGAFRQRVLLALIRETTTRGKAPHRLDHAPRETANVRALEVVRNHDHDWNREGVCRICGVDAIEGEL